MWREGAERDRRFQHIMTLGGRVAAGTALERRDIPPGGKLPEGDDWYVDNNPYKPGYRIAVRVKPTDPTAGKQLVNKQRGEGLGIVPNAKGEYWATPADIAAGTRADVDAKARAEAEAGRAEARADRRARNRDLALQEGRRADEAEQRRVDRQNKLSEALEEAKKK